MSEIKQVSTAFVAAQKKFAPALKTSTNPHFKSKYADLAACVEAVIDALNDNGIALQQFSHERDGGVAIETRLVHESGEVLNCGVLFVPSSKNDAQGYGSALTYARRYSLMSACGIAPEDDDGNKATESSKAITITQNQVLEIERLIIDANMAKEKFLSFAKIARLEDMLVMDFVKNKNAIAGYKKKVEEATNATN